MGSLNAEQILDSNDVVVQKVEVPEWDGSVNIKTLNGYEQLRFERWTGKDDDDDSLDRCAKLLILTVVDDDGKQIFSEQQLDSLKKKNAPTLLRLFDIAVRLNRLTEATRKELEKNSASALSSASSSA